MSDKSVSVSWKVFAKHLKFPGHKIEKGKEGNT